ncbi:MAG: 3-oxoacyl-ACP reductase FabG [Deltaproteobacteria bacterium]|jgi:acetoacetyl-CoA reductase|nr:3-oxoacyl-ACP reductase FabG [Deltaproteobacteria bacterium]MBW2511446.1 3-oxoacyl-ACP reductase FabG [Deltaproteobacteria bacterium]
MKKLSGKIAVVTGGSRGIGAAVAKGLGKEGATVIINYNHSQKEAETIVDEIKAMGSLAVALQADISDAEATKVFIEKALADFGKIDILVNNAGITRDKTFKKMSFEEWHKVIDTNLSSVFNTCKIALPSMLEQKYGRIINISSVIGQAGGFGQTNYAAAKAGLVGFSKSLALETAKGGVTVNCICPGYIATEMVKAMPENVREAIIAMVPMKKLGEPDEIAKGVVFICESEYMTGQCLNLNGGLYML